jgi:hypothetical protein
MTSVFNRCHNISRYSECFQYSVSNLNTAAVGNPDELARVGCRVKQ